MPRKPRSYYTETDKALMWDRWHSISNQRLRRRNIALASS